MYNFAEGDTTTSLVEVSREEEEECGVADVSNPNERWGWNRRDDPASSYILLAADC